MGERGGFTCFSLFNEENSSMAQKSKSGLKVPRVEHKIDSVLYSEGVELDQPVSSGLSTGCGLFFGPHYWHRGVLKTQVHCGATTVSPAGCFSESCVSVSNGQCPGQVKKVRPAIVGLPRSGFTAERTVWTVSRLTCWQGEVD